MLASGGSVMSFDVNTAGWFQPSLTALSCTFRLAYGTLCGAAKAVPVERADGRGVWRGETACPEHLALCLAREGVK